MNGKTAKKIRKIIPPDNEVNRRVYRRFKKQYNKVSSKARPIFLEQAKEFFKDKEQFLMKQQDLISQEDLWFDMPEFVQEKKEPYAKIVFRFENEADLQEFAELIGQKLTCKTKSSWHPFKPHRRPFKEVWVKE